MQSSTGQYSTHAGEPAQPVQHSVITASSFGFFLRGVASPFDLGSNLSSSGTIPIALLAPGAAGMPGIIAEKRRAAEPNALPGQYLSLRRLKWSVAFLSDLFGCYGARSALRNHRGRFFTAHASVVPVVNSALIGHSSIVRGLRQPGLDSLLTSPQICSKTRPGPATLRPTQSTAPSGA